jgi:hypothetical protein
MGLPPNQTPATTAPDAAEIATRRDLPPAAQRALAEAEARRHAQALEPAPGAMPEINGPKGEEPTRFGDWERKGIASDF